MRQWSRLRGRRSRRSGAKSPLGPPHQIEYKRLWYNEIIIDAKHWRSHLPDQVEAIFNNPENHRRFLAAFPHLTPESHPHVLLDATNWHSPFSMDHPDGDG